MKSIGNGWKRAQEARIRAEENQRLIKELERDFWIPYRQPSATPVHPIDSILAAQNQASTLGHLAAQMGDGMRAMTPEAMKEKAEREAPLLRNIYHADGVGYAPAGDGKLKPKTIWQRIKRALRTL